MYYCTTRVLNSRVLLMYTDPVKELPGYPVQNSPSGSFLLWGSEGAVYDIVWRRCPRKTAWMMLRTPVCSYPIIVTHLSFNFLSLLLLYSIYLNGFTVAKWKHFLPRSEYKEQMSVKYKKKFQITNHLLFHYTVSHFGRNNKKLGHLEIFCLCFLYCQGVLHSRGPMTE